MEKSIIGYKVEGYASQNYGLMGEFNDVRAQREHLESFVRECETYLRANSNSAMFTVRLNIVPEYDETQ